MKHLTHIAMAVTIVLLIALALHKTAEAQTYDPEQGVDQLLTQVPQCVAEYGHLGCRQRIIDRRKLILQIREMRRKNAAAVEGYLQWRATQQITSDIERNLDLEEHRRRLRRDLAADRRDERRYYAPYPMIDYGY